MPSLLHFAVSSLDSQEYEEEYEEEERNARHICVHSEQRLVQTKGGAMASLIMVVCEQTYLNTWAHCCACLSGPLGAISVKANQTKSVHQSLSMPCCKTCNPGPQGERNELSREQPVRPQLT